MELGLEEEAALSSLRVMSFTDVLSWMSDEVAEAVEVAAMRRCEAVVMSACGSRLVAASCSVRTPARCPSSEL